MDNEELISIIKGGMESIDHDVNELTYCGPVTGGIVNQAALYATPSRKYFVKWNIKPCTQDMFETERDSLKLLSELDLFRVPKSFLVCKDHTGNGALHILEYIEDLKPLEKWSEFGTRVGTMHTCNSRALRQARNQESNEYFVKDILNGLFTLAERKYGDREISESWSELQINVDKVFKNEEIQPEILHGDFCPVNFGQAGDDTVLFDPSCLYGDPDFELIMSDTETPLHEDFFRSYRKLRPKSTGYKNRMAVYRLFYYLIMWCHVDEEEFRTNTLSAIHDVLSLVKQIK